MDYRNLTQKEINQLQAAGCEADDWGKVLTSAPAVDHIHRVRFSGTVRFGQFWREFEFPGGLRKHAGIHDATLHNVTVGDDCPDGRPLPIRQRRFRLGPERDGRP